MFFLLRIATSCYCSTSRPFAPLLGEGSPRGSVLFASPKAWVLVAAIAAAATDGSTLGVFAAASAMPVSPGSADLHLVFLLIIHASP